MRYIETRILCEETDIWSRFGLDLYRVEYFSESYDGCFVKLIGIKEPVFLEIKFDALFNYCKILSNFETVRLN